MWSEWLRRLMLEPEHFRGLIEILLAALIAPDRKTTVNSRTGSDGVCLGKRDSVPEKEILPNVEPMVLAVDHPKYRASSHMQVASVQSPEGQGFSGENDSKSSRTTARMALLESRKSTFLPDQGSG